MTRFLTTTIAAGLIAAGAAFANPAYVGTYEMTWGNGQKGTYVIHSATDTEAEVTYTYGGKSQTKVLKIRKGKIAGGGWFPSFSLNNKGKYVVTHSGNTAPKVSKM